MKQMKRSRSGSGNAAVFPTPSPKLKRLSTSTTTTGTVLKKEDLHSEEDSDDEVRVIPMPDKTPSDEDIICID